MSNMNLSTKICEQGEINYDLCKAKEKYENSESSEIIVSDIMNEILETAMDMAINTNDSNKSTKMNIIDDYQDLNNDSCPEIKEIIDGLCKINIGNMIPKTNPEEPVSLDMEMKRLLSEMMSPPFEIVNYDNIQRKDGVGDQPLDIIEPAERENEEILKPLRPVEKKTRVTDLVMNSKKLLNNLLDEEQRKRQEEWEESNEEVIQLIELECVQSGETMFRVPKDIPPEEVPFPLDDEDIEEELISRLNDEGMDSINLNSEEIVVSKGAGDDLINSRVSQRNADEAAGNVEVKPLNTKTEKTKKKKWNFSFKFLGFKKNRKQEQLCPSSAPK